jgi:hypothetical protein
MTMNRTLSLNVKTVGALLLGSFVSMLGGGCDGRTIVGSQTGTGGSGVAGGIGGATMFGDAAIITGAGGALGPSGVPEGQGGTTGTDGGLIPRPCPVAGVAATPKTVDSMRAALSREWLLCSPLGLTHQPQEGVQITAADRYALLERDATTGNVSATSGADFEGSITYEDLGDHVQVNFSSDAGGTVSSAVVITQHPTVLIINNNGVYEYRYVLPDGS